jgi:cytochrome bd ubiquinol oxidase subunit II
VTAATGILAVIGAGVVAYTLLGGADFGGGVWDLLATGRRAGEQRTLIATTMGPVWEANHVWLIFVLIGLFSGFPTAFGALCRLLAVPMALALLGIVLRGGAFVFRQYGSATDGTPVLGTVAWGRVFAIASALTPAVLGLCAGAAATGRLGGAFPPVAAGLGFTFCAYLAAVYLCREAEVRNQPGLVRDLRRRALAAAAVAGALALVALPVLAHDAPVLSDRLWHRASPLVVLSVLGGAASIVTVVRNRFAIARVFAALAVTSVLVGWGLAAYPYVLPGLTVAGAAGPPQTQPVILAVLIAGFAVTVPALVLLLRVFGKPS